MARYVSDLETDGLLDEVTTIHCAVLKDLDTGETRGFRPHEITEYIRIIQEADLIVFHNGIWYDLPVIKKLYGVELDKSKVEDTLVLARLLFPDIKQTDFKRFRRWKEYREANPDWEQLPELPVRRFDGNLIGAHSLKAWGQRIGNFKGEYKGGWSRFNEDMYDYMLQDAEVTYDLWWRFQKYRELIPHSAVKLDHRISWVVAEIERNGFPFDAPKAHELYRTIVNERESLKRKLQGAFQPWDVQLPDFIPKRDNRTKGYKKGVPVKKSKTVHFNPLSRQHIAHCLITKYGWEPVEFTQEREKDTETGEWIQKGSPKVDDEILSNLPYPECVDLARLFMLHKRATAIADGNEAWLRVMKNGRVHARYNPHGTITGRASHSKPNISQVPKVTKPFGPECRELFHVPEGWTQVGIDQAGLELRCLAHYLSYHDGGRYARIVCEGDVHWENAKALFGLKAGTERYGPPGEDGEPTKIPEHERYREIAKTFIYAFLYGAGDELIGSFVGGGAAEGRQLKERFMKAIPGLRKVLKEVNDYLRDNGKLLALDGHFVPTRSFHSAFNFQLQSAGSTICKQWVSDFRETMEAEGFVCGWDGDYVIMSWSHDEIQVAVRNVPDLMDRVIEIATLTGRRAGEPFKFKCPLDVEAKTGMNWATCH